MSEYDLMMSVFKHYENNPHVLIVNTFGEFLSRNKKMQKVYHKGITDLIIIIHNEKAIYCELKRPGKKIEMRPEQVQFRKRVEDKDNYIVSNEFNQIIDFIDYHVLKHNYLKFQSDV